MTLQILRRLPSAVTIAEAAIAMDVSVSRVRFYRRYGVLEAVMVGNLQAVTLESLRRLIAQRRAMRMEHARVRTRLRLVVDNG